MAELLLNAHSKMWTWMLEAGQNQNDEERIKDNMLCKNNTTAPIYGLRKDHK